MERIITGDETWVYEYDMQSTIIEMADQKRAKTEQTTPKQVKSEGDAHCFLRYSRCDHYEFLPEGQTVYKEYYLAVLRRLREKIRRQRPELWEENSWILHDDNAPSHRAHVVTELKTKN